MIAQMYNSIESILNDQKQSNYLFCEVIKEESKKNLAIDRDPNVVRWEEREKLILVEVSVILLP